MAGERIRLAKFYERVSAGGTRYMVGRFALAKVVLFQGEPTDDGTPTWDAYVVPADQQLD